MGGNAILDRRSGQSGGEAEAKEADKERQSQGAVKYFSSTFV